MLFKTEIRMYYVPFCVDAFNIYSLCSLTYLLLTSLSSFFADFLPRLASLSRSYKSKSCSLGEEFVKFAQYSNVVGQIPTQLDRFILHSIPTQLNRFQRNRTYSNVVGHILMQLDRMISDSFQTLVNFSKVSQKFPKSISNPLGSVSNPVGKYPS